MGLWFVTVVLLLLLICWETRATEYVGRSRGCYCWILHSEEPLAVAVRKVLAAPRKRDVFLLT